MAVFDSIRNESDLVVISPDSLYLLADFLAQVHKESAFYLLYSVVGNIKACKSSCIRVSMFILLLLLTPLADICEQAPRNELKALLREP